MNATTMGSAGKKITVLGGGSSIATMPPQAQTASPPAVVLEPMAQTASLPVVISASFPMTLDATQQKAVAEQLARVDFMTINLANVATLGSETEKSLHSTLDGFLARVNQLDNPRLFRLATDLNEAVTKENLPELADRILTGELSWGDKFRGFFNRKALAKAANDFWEETKRLVSGSTKTLVDLISKMERELVTEQKKLDAENVAMGQLGDAYKQRFADFVIATAFLSAFHERAKEQLAMAMSTADMTNMVVAREMNELQDKLQNLESRALALEGTLTRLPADQLVLRQLRNSGIQTLQETTTTASSRFASIKMTLITINYAMINAGVQRLADQGKALDENLTVVRGKMMKEVVTKSANAPGDNRLAQAQQLKDIVKETAELTVIVEQARVTNQQKFTETRQLFSEARQAMIEQGIKSGV